jgi:threonine/homoserine/homoserine lactone efflux protein
MSLIIHFILGYVISFVGTTPPSMLNMTTAKITLEKTKKEGIKFALGVSIIVLLQAYIALIFTRYIHNNANFEWYIQVVGIFIFIILSFYFFKQAVQERKQEIKSNKKFKNSFVIGLMLSTLNMFAVPFYCGVSSALKMFGLFEFNQTNILLFVIGSALGTYSLLYVYASSAIKIHKKASLLTKNLNYILSGLTAFIALVTLIKML